MGIRRIASVCVAVALVSFPVAATAKDDPWITHWFPFEIVHNRITVPVKVAGVDAKAMFDTGSNIAFIDRELAQKAGVKVSEGRRMTVSGAHSDKSVPVASKVPIELFGAPLNLRDVPAGDLGAAGLIIGIDVLSSFAIQIDFANARIRFASRSATRLDETANVEMKTERGTRLPAVRARVDGEPMWLMLDTGMAGPLRLKTGFALDRGWEKVSDTSTFDVHGKEKVAEVYRVPLLQLGPYELRGVKAIVQPKGHVSREEMARDYVGVRTSGILGAEVLRRFVVTIDLRERKLHLVPAEVAAPETAPAPAS